MKKEEVRQQIIDVGIVPVMRVSSPNFAMTAAEAVAKGGIPIVEVTMTIPKAVEVIRKLVVSMVNDVIIGAGTVMDAQTAEQCLDAGAEFLVSPVFDAATVELARREDKLMMAGALTPTEVVHAWSHGSDFVKVFPCGSVGGPKYIRALRGPLPHIPLIPTGGVSLATSAAFIEAGAAALGVGTELISESELSAGNHREISRLAQEFVSIIREARQSVALASSGNGKGAR